MVLRLIWICKIQWWCSLFSFWSEIHFCANLVQKIKTVSFSWNLHKTNLNIQNYVENMWCWLFFILDQKNAFWANLVKKNKNVSLSWNLVPRLNWICGIQWCWLFQFLTGNTFLGKFGPKTQNCQFELKFQLIWICTIM